MATYDLTTPTRPKRKTLPALVLPRAKSVDGTFNLYVKNGEAYHRAADNLVVECAQHIIDAEFQIGASAVKSNAQAIDFLTLHLGYRDEEVFAIMLLTADRRFIGYEELTRGTVVTCPVELRLVMQAVVRSRASSVIIAHCHPQGRVEPSDADVSITSRLWRALKMIDVELLDHIIVGAEVFSFYDRGYLKEPWLALRAQA